MYKNTSLVNLSSLRTVAASRSYKLKALELPKTFQASITPGHNYIIFTFCTGMEPSPEELLKLVAKIPTQFTKCSFRVDTTVRPPGYCGRLPTPDSPDIKIPGRVRGVYEDDVVVLEIQTDAGTRNEKGQRKGTVVHGHIKGEHNFMYSLRSNKNSYVNSF